MAGRKAMPVAASLLEDRDPDVRIAAAELLCFGGATELGVPALLREGRGFTVLNLLRSPDLWKAMAAARTPDCRKRRPPSAFARSLSRRDWSSSLRTRRARRSDAGRPKAAGKKTPATLLATLESLLRFSDGSSGRYEVVLEKDRIRILPRAEAEAFWRAVVGKVRRKTHDPETVGGGA
jgi:hypothetical protein